MQLAPENDKSTVNYSNVSQPDLSTRAVLFARSFGASWSQIMRICIPFCVMAIAVGTFVITKRLQSIDESLRRFEAENRSIRREDWFQSDEAELSNKAQSRCTCPCGCSVNVGHKTAK